MSCNLMPLSSLANAILSRSRGDIQIAIQKGEALDQLDEYGLLPLIEACLTKDVSLVEYLLHLGAPINAQDITGRTALHWATDQMDLEMISCLLARHADPNILTYSGQSPLVMPLLKQQKRIIQSLVQAGAIQSLAQDFIAIKTTAHRYHLTGKTDLFYKDHFVEIDHQGFFLDCSLGILISSLQQYIHHMMNPHVSIFRQILPVFQHAQRLLFYQRYDCLERPLDWDRNPLLLPIAHQGHAWTIVKHGKMMAICDRQRDYIALYQLHHTSIDWLKLLYEPFSADAMDHIPKTLFKKIPVSKQITGNCSWANLEISIMAILFFCHIEEKKIQRIYQLWEKWDQAHSLAVNIHQFKYVHEMERKMTYAALLTAILFQKEDLSSKYQDYILQLLLASPFQFILKSYLKVYKQHPKGLVFQYLLRDFKIE